ncbi:MAG: ScpA family protein [Candidatus Taylorbacteria bacterium]
MDTSTQFKVKTDVFEGPLDLLLNLIEKRKLLINDISLAKVTDDFIEHVKRHEAFPISDSADFIFIASTLLLVKSKSLLPNLDLTDEEEGSIEDLERRLKIYKEIKDLALHIKEMFGKELIFGRLETKNITPIFTPEATIQKDAVYLAIEDILRNFPMKEMLPQVKVSQVVSLEKMIEHLTERIKSSLKMSFREFSKYGKSEKVHVIVSFLAMLELVKQGIISVHQEKKGDDIHMETEEVGTPRYGN